MLFDVMCVGEMVIDFTPGREEGSYIRNAGGAPANVAIALSRFGRISAFCGKLGNDDFGRFLLRTLQEDKVQMLCNTLTDRAVTTMTFVTLGENGERSFTFARKPGADMLLKPNDIAERDIQNSTVVHAGSCSLSRGSAREATKLAMRLGHENGELVSFDLNYRELLWENGEEAERQIKSVLPYVDLLKVSDEEVFLIGGEKHIPDMMNDYGISTVVLTRGSEGARAYFGGRMLQISAGKADVADTNGAGDAFWGGFLSSILDQGVVSTAQLDDETIWNALRFGTAAGWLTVQKYGAIPALPTKVQVEDVLNNPIRGEKHGI